MKYVVLFSGGQDSTTCLYWAVQAAEGRRGDVLALSVNYGQKHAIELEAAAKIASIAGVRHEVIELPAGVLAGKSPLLPGGDQLEIYEDAAHMTSKIGDRIEHTFVPLRNLLFMVLAANRAAVLGAKHIVAGICEADTANYPDCRQVYANATEDAIFYAMGADRLDGPPRVKLVAPLLKLNKAETVRLAKRLPGCYDALAYSHTAYDGKYPPVGQDHASLLRASGFLEASTPDPLVVRAWAEGKMELPGTSNYDVVRRLFDGGPMPAIGWENHVYTVADAVSALSASEIAW